MKKDWADQLLCLLEKDKNNTAQSFTAFVQETNERISTIKIKLQRLLDGYLEQDIERETYRNEKAKLMSEKKTLEEKTTNLEQRRTGWVEPMAEWIKEAENLPKIAQESKLFEKKVACRTLFGSNLVLAGGNARTEGAESGANAPQNQWAALCVAHDLVLKKPKSFVLVGEEGVEPS